MKICILTQPLHKNYGGLLQAYALQKFLKDLGHEVYTADIPFKKPRFFGLRTIVSLFVKKYLLLRDIPRVLPISKAEKLIIQKYTDQFKSEYINLTEHIDTVSEIDKLEKYNFDAYVVGSDQVWRPAYSPGILTYFLDFLSPKSKAKKIAYAASFGIDNCDEFSGEEKIKIKELLKSFDFVGVREDTAVTLCKHEFNVKAKHVIDPTMLIFKDEYIKLVEKSKVPKHNGEIFAYVLDQDPKKQAFIKRVEKIKQLNSFTVLPESNLATYPPIQSWIRAFIDAEYIVTDSFHGVVFSLLFNKQFLAIGNHGRGLARFQSILNKFNLLDRLVLSPDDITNSKILEEIDYTNVNKILDAERKFAIKQIKKSLCEQAG
ncbi:polysaccharide pyruvyl transferase family protein [Vibrio breoganii]|uniref:polysaccharide pyruvyl transferase family protein n=1 Tax=Vibrio breoganii TaxID=553239 RepID=UPI000C832E1D|nr:polysaccharide pyruvyl transferase family protein [Vibrio breoganii]PMK56608.1 hypothetical protein BCT98_09385 [Vibrio breoganii]